MVEKQQDLWFKKEKMAQRWGLEEDMVWVHHSLYLDDDSRWWEHDTTFTLVEDESILIIKEDQAPQWFFFHIKGVQVSRKVNYRYWQLFFQM